jgi:hypothetical protein
MKYSRNKVEIWPTAEILDSSGNRSKGETLWSVVDIGNYEIKIRGL